MSGIFRVIFVTLAAAFLAGAAQAQTKPQVTSLGPDFPKSEIFIGNSFYYYNNGLPGHVSLLEKAGSRSRAQAGLSRRHGDDRRCGARLA